MLQDAIEAEKADIARLVDKSPDISQFFVDKVEITTFTSDLASQMMPVTYPDPCHLKKSLGVAAQPRALIQAHPGCRLQEMTESDWL
jgi:glycolate oxidase iron-sulfur subunit